LKRKIFSVLFALVLIVSFSPVAAVYADEEGWGEFETKAATVEVTFATGSMTPLVEVTVTANVTVDSSLTLADLTEVKFKVYYDTTGATDVTEFDAKTASHTECGIITWTPTNTFTEDFASSTSWAKGTCVTPTLSNSTGNFSFVFTPGKVATETAGAYRWVLAAKATCTLSADGFGYDSTPPTMNAYSSLAIAPAVSVDWGIVHAGMDFGESDPSEEAIGATITIISNGDYSLKAKSSSVWTGASDNATLDAGGTCSSAQEFALKADDDGTLDGAVVLTTSAQDIATGTITTESGFDYASAALWLKLASTFSDDTYSGTITYSVSN